MKKSLFILPIFIVLGIVLAVHNNYFNNTKIEYKEFKISDYQWAIEHYSFSQNIGFINKAETAMEKAKELWMVKYGTINGKPYNAINGQRICVFYDPLAECWYIHGTLPPHTLGGVPHALIKKNGDVLAVWHDQ